MAQLPTGGSRGGRGGAAGARAGRGLLAWVTLLTAAAAGTLAPSETQAAITETRGTWISTTNLSTSGHALNTVAKSTQTFKRLRDIGLNTVYMDVWRNGNTQFNSPTQQALLGRSIDPALGSRDLLQETVLQAHRNQTALVAWYQYGNMAKFGNPGTSSTELAKYMGDRGWLLQDSAGAYTNSSTGFTWMNPLVPEVRAYIKGIVLDAVTRYDINGIQFDDHLGWPVQFGYDAYTKAAYKAEKGVDPPASSTDATWMAWRAGKVTAFAQELVGVVRAARPGIVVSLSPSIYDFSYRNSLVDWPAWVSQGLFDEYLPQVYRESYSAFDTTWDGTGANVTTGGQVPYMGARKADFGAGIAFTANSVTPPWTDIKKELDLTRASSGYGGHALWFVDGVLTNEANLLAYYDVAGLGQAERQDYPLSLLPAPLVLATAGSNQWTITIDRGGVYDLIAGQSDVWRVVQSLVVLPGGTYTFTVPNATRVELLYVGRLTVVPEPGGAGVVGAAAVVGLRRRKRTED